MWFVVNGCVVIMVHDTHTRKKSIVFLEYFYITCLEDNWVILLSFLCTFLISCLEIYVCLCRINLIFVSTICYRRWVLLRRSVCRFIGCFILVVLLIFVSVSDRSKRPFLQWPTFLSRLAILECNLATGSLSVHLCVLPSIRPSVTSRYWEKINDHITHRITQFSPSASQVTRFLRSTLNPCYKRG